MQTLGLYLCGDDKTTSILPLLNDGTCLLVETAIKSWDSRHKPALFQTRHILNVASVLPDDHPGWRLMSLMVEHTDASEKVMEGRFPIVLDTMGRLKNRILDDAFGVLRPFAVIVWVECRLKIHTDLCDSIRFPNHWKSRMKQDARSSGLVSTTVFRSLLEGKINMIFAYS